MARSNPFFSIIVPAFNPNPAYFQACMDSLLNQSFRDFEIILSDDGSRKEWAERFDEYARGDDRVSVLHRENGGVSAARNEGIARARGDWIVFVDADDWIEGDALERLHAYLLSTECDVLLFRAVKEFAGRRVEMKYGLDADRVCDLADFPTKEKLYKRAMSTPNLEGEDLCVIYYSWDKVFSRRFLQDNGLLYPVGIENSEDKVFVLRCLEKMNKMYAVGDVLYHYRINSESASKKYKENADAQRIALAAVLEEIAKRMDGELSRLSGRRDYHRIYDEYMRFCFGIISDVFNYKYYHPGYPRDRKRRNKEVRAFLNQYPFDKAIRYVRFSELSNVAKVKKLLLTLKLPGLFFRLKNGRMKRAGEIPMGETGSGR